MSNLKVRDYAIETEKRAEFIRAFLKSSGAKGIVFGNSGGKDCALVGILSKIACPDTVGIFMPSSQRQKSGLDYEDAKLLSEKFEIGLRTVDIAAVKDGILQCVAECCEVSENAERNIAPRVRMTVLYTIAASENRIVAGTSNYSERYMGYFTKWGDGACDFNPIADLTATEVLQFLKHLNAPESIIEKPPSAGLFEGQTDESDMGVTYKSIDKFLLTGKCPPGDMEIIERYHRATEHKRDPSSWRYNS
jgi:NAD+ synthase